MGAGSNERRRSGRRKAIEETMGEMGGAMGYVGGAIGRSIEQWEEHAVQRPLSS